MILVILVITFFYCLFLNRFVTKDILSPPIISVLFLFSYLFFLLDRTHTENNFYLSFIYLVSCLLLFLPSVLFTIRSHERYVNISSCLNEFRFNQLQKIFIIVFFLICLIIYIYVEFMPLKGVFPLFESFFGNIKNVDIEKIHRVGKDSPLQFFASQLYVLGGMLLLWGLNSTSKKTQFILIGLALFVPILGLIKTSKSDIVFPLLFYFILFYYRKGKIKNKKIIIYSFLSVILLLYLTFLRVDSLGGIYSTLIDYDIQSDIFAFESILYGYTAGSVDNLFLYLTYYQYPLLNDNLGLSALKPVATIFQVSRDIAFDASLVYLPNLGPGATVGTYMRICILEGGVFFLFFISFFYGCLISLTYSYFLKRKSVTGLFIYAVFFIPWIMLFFQNLFANLNIYFSVVLVFFIMNLKRIR